MNYLIQFDVSIFILNDTTTRGRFDQALNALVLQGRTWNQQINLYECMCSAENLDKVKNLIKSAPYYGSVVDVKEIQEKEKP